MSEYLQITPTEKALQLLRNAKEDVAQLLNPMKNSGSSHIAINLLTAQIYDDIEDALNRAKEEKIRLGILGGRGSGKSTLTNALIGNEILPRSAQIFCTLLPTTIRYESYNLLYVESEYPEYNCSETVISLEKMKKVLASLTKESENPNNTKSYRHSRKVLLS